MRSQTQINRLQRPDHDFELGRFAGTFHLMMTPQHRTNEIRLGFARAPIGSDIHGWICDGMRQTRLVTMGVYIRAK
jgi:hypothetical protein